MVETPARPLSLFQAHREWSGADLAGRPGLGAGRRAGTNRSRCCRYAERPRREYRGHEGTPSGRTVEPHRPVCSERRWYPVAWDLDRADCARRADRPAQSGSWPACSLFGSGWGVTAAYSGWCRSNAGDSERIRGSVAKLCRGGGHDVAHSSERP